MPPLPPVPASTADDAARPVFARGSDRVAVVTVGIPCYNRPKLLAEALASLAAQDGFEDFDVVVCDDGGDPETRRVVESSALRNVRLFVNRPTLGPVRNWNRCIEVATAPWITILHEDDLVYPWFLKTVAPHLRGPLAAVSVRCVQGPTPPALAPPTHLARPARYAATWFLKGSMTPFPGVVFSRQTAQRIGGFDPKQGGLADYAFWYELARSGGIEILREHAAFYRVNEGQWTERAWPEMLRRAHLLRLRIAREQLATHPKLGRWIARFFTSRMARSYRHRFAERPATLLRAERLNRIPFSRVPSGWVWALLKRLA